MKEIFGSINNAMEKNIILKVRKLPLVLFSIYLINLFVYLSKHSSVYDICKNFNYKFITNTEIIIKIKYSKYKATFTKNIISIKQ